MTSGAGLALRQFSERQPEQASPAIFPLCAMFRSLLLGDAPRIQPTWLGRHRAAWLGEDCQLGFQSSFVPPFNVFFPTLPTATLRTGLKGNSALRGGGISYTVHNARGPAGRCVMDFVVSDREAKAKIPRPLHAVTARIEGKTCGGAC